jgi:hypothetical protein
VKGTVDIPGLAKRPVWRPKPAAWAADRSVFSLLLWVPGLKHNSFDNRLQFRLELGETEPVSAFLGHDNKVQGWQGFFVAAKEFPQQPFHPVAWHRFP